MRLGTIMFRGDFIKGDMLEKGKRGIKNKVCIINKHTDKNK